MGKQKFEIELAKAQAATYGIEQTATVTIYPPKIKTVSDILPPLEELRNCTTCRKGRKLPEELVSDPDHYVRQCTWDIHTHRGNSHYANDCENHIRKRKEDLTQ